MIRKLMPAAAAVILLASAGANAAGQERIPFPEALDRAAVTVESLDSILDDGLIIGNGDVNGLLYSRSGNLVLVITKNDVWDARLDSRLDPPLPTLARIKELGSGNWPDRSWVLPEGSDWKGPDSYHAHAYPCPRACARLVLGEGAGKSLSIDLEKVSASRVKAMLDLRRAAALVEGSEGGPPEATLRALADRNVFLILSDAPVRLLPFESADVPAPESGETEGVRWIAQHLPGDPDWPGMAFCVALAEAGALKAAAVETSMESKDFKAAAVRLARSTLGEGLERLTGNHEDLWRRFWSRSGIGIEDELLESTWYRNLYFLRCVSKPGVVCPGLFAGLINERPAWHGDYHTNYNIQQTFFGCYSANHPELAEPYDRLIHGYLPRARWLARTIFGMDGAYYPHVLFAYEPPDPEQCESPGGRQYIHHVWGFTLGVAGFSVQPLWWHYKHAPDQDFLERIAYPAVRDVAVFYADFVDQCEKRDGRAVLAPSVSPEHWGWTPAFERNRNCAFDIAMVRYILEAAIEGAERLGRDGDLTARFSKTLARLPDFPATGDERPVVVDVEGAPPITYNIAVPATPVFPCDVVTWRSPAAEQDLFARTIEKVQWNGNNSTVILSVARARLGMEDTAGWLKEEVRARLRPNGTLTLNRLGHRFNDFGHYTEQFGATMAVTELLLQSVGDVIRLYPAWPESRQAAFANLRAQGGFLVSAEMKDGKVGSLEVESTEGGRLRLASPWKRIRMRVGKEGGFRALTPDGRGVVDVETSRGDCLEFVGG
jgi:hypothetical protein